MNHFPSFNFIFSLCSHRLDSPSLSTLCPQPFNQVLFFHHALFPSTTSEQRCLWDLRHFLHSFLYQLKHANGHESSNCSYVVQQEGTLHQRISRIQQASVQILQTAARWGCGALWRWWQLMVVGVQKHWRKWEKEPTERENDTFTDSGLHILMVNAKTWKVHLMVHMVTPAWVIFADAENDYTSASHICP